MFSYDANFHTTVMFIYVWFEVLSFFAICLWILSHFYVAGLQDGTQDSKNSHLSEQFLSYLCPNESSYLCVSSYVKSLFLLSKFARVIFALATCQRVESCTDRKPGHAMTSQPNNPVCQYTSQTSYHRTHVFTIISSMIWLSTEVIILAWTDA